MNKKQGDQQVSPPVPQNDGANGQKNVSPADWSSPLIGEKLRESEKRFRALVTATSDGIYVMSPDWEVMYALDGRGFLPDTGAPITDWMDKYIHPADQEMVRGVIERAISSKSIFELEHRVLRADGGLGWTFSRAIPVLDEKGNIVEWFGTASDVTPRKNAEATLLSLREELEDRKRLYEAITGSTPDLIYVFDLNYRFIYANKALLNMWGRSEVDAMGRGLLELGYEPWHAEMHEREIDQVIATRMPIRGEVSFPHATLGKRMYDYIFTPVLNENNDVVAIAGTTRDISDMKAFEEKLEQLVQERTLELQRSNADLLQFAHVASHDLKEPVRKVKTFLSRLEADAGSSLSEDARGYLDRMYSATDRMYKMIDGVLAYSTLSNTEQAFSEVDLNQVIREIETDLEIPIQQKGARLQYDQLPVFQGAPMLIYQLFYNLVNNSLKFSKKGISPVIVIDSQTIQTDEGDAVQIRIRDNGIGFDPESADRIFSTFTRLHSKDEYEGTGLGLALCKKIVERHNGTLTATGKEGEGATFVVTLPL